MNENCNFCQIIKAQQKEVGTIFEDKKFIAFLDHRPVFIGHTLLMPKSHVETLKDLPNNLIKPLFFLTQQIANAVEAGMLAEGTFVGINNRISQSVPHLHIHIIPRKKGDGLRGFFWPRQKYTDEAQIISVQNAIKKCLPF